MSFLVIMQLTRLIKSIFSGVLLPFSMERVDQLGLYQMFRSKACMGAICEDDLAFNMLFVFDFFKLSTK